MVQDIVCLGNKAKVEKNKLLSRLSENMLRAFSGFEFPTPARPDPQLKKESCWISDLASRTVYMFLQ